MLKAPSVIWTQYGTQSLLADQDIYELPGSLRKQRALLPAGCNHERCSMALRVTHRHSAQEYDGRTEDAELMPAQCLAKQRKSLKRQLGLDQAGMDQLVDTNDLIKDEDLVASGSAKSPAQAGQKDVASLISDMTGTICQELKCYGSAPFLSLHHNPTFGRIAQFLRSGVVDVCNLQRGRLLCRAERA